jgi:hypothetical protein
MEISIFWKKIAKFSNQKFVRNLGNFSFKKSQNFQVFIIIIIFVGVNLATFETVFSFGGFFWLDFYKNFAK